ncbi:MAG: hypothetical protein ACW964_08510 [Candidatus Hodarchaeales archaeon]
MISVVTGITLIDVVWMAHLIAIIGMEILIFTILLIIIFTPSICEYLQPLKILSYQSKVNTSGNPNSSF